MVEIAKINGVPIANIAKVNGVAIANIAKINGLTVPAADALPYTTGLLLDLDVADLSLSNTDPVSSWTSKESYAFSQATGSLQPSFRTAYINGNDAVLFGGDVLVGSGNLNLKSFFIVGKNERVSTTDYYGLFSGTAGNAKAIIDSTKTWYVGEDVSNVYKNNVDTNNCGNDFAVFYFEMGANKNEIYQIGQDRNSAGRFWGGPVLRIVGYDDNLSAENRAAVFTYLQTKYGIE